MYVGLHEVVVQANRERDGNAEQDHHAGDCEVGLFRWLINLLTRIFSPAGH
jgi:hypothetical protein